MKKSIALHQKLQLSVHDTDGTSKTTVSFMSPSSTSLLPALCSHMGWTPALHVAGLGFNLSQETGYLHRGFFL
jgi:hypothetical protein